MRTNILVNNSTVVGPIIIPASGVGEVLSQAGIAAMCLVEPDSEGSVGKYLNILFTEPDSRYLGNERRETRMIPINTCDIKVTEANVFFGKKNKFCSELYIGSIDNLSDLVGEDLSIRIVIPAVLNGRNSWNFSHRVKYGEEIDDVRRDLYSQIMASSIKEHLELNVSDSYPNGTSVLFFTNSMHDGMYAYAMDSLPPSSLAIETGIGPGHSIREFINKVIIDADANYGFDYINCPNGDFYPNQLRYRDVEKLLFNIATEAGTGEYNIGLTHITFTEPRIVETTGDVVKQVINIIHPIANIGHFVINDYSSFVTLLEQ